jgi:hypothetical protein
MGVQRWGCGGEDRQDLRRQKPKAIYIRVYNGFATSMQN